MEIREQIIKAMEMRGMTQADLSRASGLSKQMLSKIILGKNTDIMLSTAVALAHALDVDYNYLFGWEDTSE